jgi:formate hydrogenlyase transcriptional activator
MQGNDRLSFDALEIGWMFLTAMAAVSDEAEQARLTAGGIPSLLRCSLSGMALRRDTGATWDLVLYQEGEQLSGARAGQILIELDRLFTSAMTQGTVRLPRAGASIPPSLARLGVRSLMVVPLRTLCSQVGMLLVGRGSLDGFSCEEERTLHTLAAHLAIIIENGRLQQALRRAAENLERFVEERTAQLRRSEAQQRVLLEITNAIMAKHDLESLFRAITQTLREVLPFDRATLTLYDPQQDLLRAAASEGVSPATYIEISRRDNHVGWVIEQQASLLRRDLARERQLAVDDQLLAKGIRSRLVVPLIANGQTLGTLNLKSHTQGQYAEGDAAFLHEVAQQVALAVENLLAYEEIARLKAQLEQESLHLQEELKTEHNFEEIIGQSTAMKRVLHAVEMVAPTAACVLLFGETGTGKELVARAIHHLSPRKGKALVKVHCPALPTGLLESELFGHEKGAFTGALARRMGRFELAHGGTIFLDEIGDLPLEMQAKLLRVLQDGEFERVGGTDTFRADVRVIAATNRDLERAMQEGRFRQDLFYRLNVFPIRLPALRERPEDIPLLVAYFAMKHARRLGKRIETIPHKMLEALQTYPWPGNVRELEHLIERAVILSQSSRLELGEWRPHSGVTPHSARILTIEEVERRHIREVLELTGWRVSGERGAARLLGLKPTTLEARMKKLGIRRPG